MKFLNRIGKKNILKHEEMPPITLLPGDSIQLSYTETDINTGEVIRSKVVLRQEIDTTMTLTEALVFKCDDEDYNALGGAFLEKK